MKISTFSGQYKFLSNMYPAEFVWDNIVWRSSEHAYVAAKITDRILRIEISKIRRAGDVKRFGRTLELRPDWEEVKIDMMREIVRAKFTQNPLLKDWLIATGDAHIEEGNTWNDRFWGICPPDSDNGRNELGKILMQLRVEMGGKYSHSHYFGFGDE